MCVYIYDSVYSEAVSPLNTDDMHQIITITTNSIFVFIIVQSSYVYIHIYVEKYIFVCSSQFSTMCPYWTVGIFQGSVGSNRMSNQVTSSH